MDIALFAVLAAAFAVVNGTNDGATLVSVGLKISSLRPLSAILVLVLSVVFVPLIVGTAVATTLTSRLVQFEGPTGHQALATAVLAATLVAVALSRIGLPTSLTLSLIGGITGAGIGAGLPIEWSNIVFVFVLAALAPALGALLAYVLAGVSLRLPKGMRSGSTVSGAHRAAYGVQCFAYGANDGQKMLAVFALLTHPVGMVETVPTSWLVLMAIGVCFVLGLLLGLPKISVTVDSGVLASRPYDAVVAETSASIAVLGTAAIGVPVSMTQAVTAALVGVGSRSGYRRIRWPVVINVAGAWLITLPSAGLMAYLAASVVTRRSG